MKPLLQKHIAPYDRSLFWAAFIITGLKDLFTEASNMEIYISFIAWMLAVLTYHFVFGKKAGVK